jgi:hypothetical protein
MDGLDRQGGEGFTIRCNKCEKEIEINAMNVKYFVNEYGWSDHDFKVSDEMPIGAFVTYDTSNETVLCKCGNRVER